jgi:hypothetical protein
MGKIISISNRNTIDKRNFHKIDSDIRAFAFYVLIYSVQNSV